MITLEDEVTKRKLLICPHTYSVLKRLGYIDKKKIVFHNGRWYFEGYHAKLVSVRRILGWDKVRHFWGYALGRGNEIVYDDLKFVLKPLRFTLRSTIYIELLRNHVFNYSKATQPVLIDDCLAYQNALPVMFWEDRMYRLSSKKNTYHSIKKRFRSKIKSLYLDYEEIPNHTKDRSGGD